MANVHGIQLARGEELVREYRATQLERPRTEGYLLVTNRRVVFTGEAVGLTGSSILVQECQIPDVSGISAYSGVGINIASLIVAAVLALAGIWLGSSVFWLLWLLVVPALWIGYRVFQSRGRTFALVVQSRSSQQSPVALWTTEATSRFGLTGGHAAQAAVAGPGPDAERLFTELGALILDLQAEGDLAVERWRQTPSGEGATRLEAGA